jgi:hypothetical protein
MIYKLVQKSVNPVIAKFQVTNQRGDIVGSINVPPEDVEVLLRHWSGPADRPQVGNSAPARKFSKPGRMSRQAILRGC